jgi:hypothetical protein
MANGDAFEIGVEGIRAFAALRTGRGKREAR